MNVHRLAASSALIAALSAAPALAAGWYGGVDFGTASMDESAPFGVPTSGFGGPTVDHDLCGDTAVITIGAQPSVNRIDNDATGYRVFVGTRTGAWSWEFGMFNVARLEGRAESAPYAVAQPVCNPVPSSPITVQARGVQLESVAFSGLSFSPVWSWSFAEDWTLDLRGTIAFWDREERSQWQIEVTELQNAVPLQTYPITQVTDEAGGSGVDLWYGVGVSWRVRDDLRLRAIVERENFRDLSTLTWTVGVAIDF